MLEEIPLANRSTPVRQFDARKVVSAVCRRPCGRPVGSRLAAVFPCVLILVGIALVAGCAKVKTVSETIYTSNGIKIQLVEQQEKESGRPVSRDLDHPWDVSIEELDNLLGSILYQQTVMFFRGKKTNAFPDEQRREMLGPIRDAFGRATPSQVVDFSFTQHRKWLIMTRDSLTDGVLFRKGGKFHCAFRNLAMDDLGDPEGSGAVFRGDPTQEPVRTSWVLFVGPGQQLVKESSGGLFGARTFPNWIRLDLARSWSPPEDAEAIPVEAVADEVRVGDAAEAVPVSRAEIEKRLSFLEELRREGAIADTVYEDKKQELMDLLMKVEPAPTAAE